MRRKRWKIRPVPRRPTLLANALRKIHPVLSRPTLWAGALLAAALAVFLCRQMLSPRGTARDVPIALV